MEVTHDVPQPDFSQRPNPIVALESIAGAASLIGTPFHIPDHPGQRWHAQLFFVGVAGAGSFILAFVLGAIWLYHVSAVQDLFRPLFIWMSYVMSAPEPSAPGLHFGMLCYALVLLAVFFLYRLDVPVVTVCTLWGLGVSCYEDARGITGE